MSDPATEGAAALNQLNHVSELMPKAPRLGEALISGPIGTQDWFRTGLERSGKKISLSTDGFADELGMLLGHIEERLDKGLAEAWLAPQTYDWRPPEDLLSMSADEIQKFLKVLQFWASPEESWARAFTELVVYSMYAGSGQAYFGSEAGDEMFYERFPAVYPISMACQHLSTLCILSRGFPLSQIRSSFAVGCGCTASTVSYEVFEKKATFGPGGGDYRYVPKLMKIPLGPGDVVIYNPKGPGSGEQNGGKMTHIGSVLRTSGARIQFIDTGVLVGDDEGGDESGTVDHKYASGDIEKNNSMVAWGKIRAATDLTGCAARLAAARPLGVARLALLDATDTSHAQVRYVSKLLHMQYPVSRLLWSLRGLPVEGLAAIWYVYVPQWDWAAAVLDTTAPLAPPASLFTSNRGQISLANVIRGRENGSAVVYRKNREDFVASGSTIKVKTAPEMELTTKLALAGASTLDTWCRSSASFGKRYLRRPGDKEGTIDEGETGVSFFDP